MKLSFTNKLCYQIRILLFVFIYTVSAILFSLLSFITLADGKISFSKRLSAVYEIFTSDGTDGIFGSYFFDNLAFSALPCNVSLDTEESKAFTVILDPGHGGPDPGAEGVTGEKEKNLNFSVAMKTAEFLRLRGVNVLFTRESDIWLADEKDSHKKHGDVKNRVEFCKNNPNDAFVSIHMNAFPLESCRGAQIFYSDNSKESIKLAEIIKKNITDTVQPENNRPVKDGGSSIFVLDRIETCAVLIECGFISNYDEAALLNDDSYRNKLSFVIAQSIYEYLNTIQKDA